MPQKAIFLLPIQRNFINLITLKSNRGKGVAIRTGLSIAKYNSVLIFDSDLEIPPPEIKNCKNIFLVYDFQVYMKIIVKYIPGDF